jgi:DNA-directed RNA polymerase alpha subunit
MKLNRLINLEKTELQQNLTVRTSNLLETIGVSTFEQLAEQHDHDLLKISGFNRKNLTECLDMLEQYYKEILCESR